jgi:hypothetical protein
MTKKISDHTKSKLHNYEKSSLAMLVVRHAIDNSFSINDIAKAADVSRMAITNWVNGSVVRHRNLANLVIKLKFESIIPSLLEPNKSLDQFNATVIKKYFALQSEWNELKIIIEKIKLEKPDLGKVLVQRKYFKYFGRQMMDAAFSGHCNYDPVVLPWDTDDIKNINSVEDYADFCFDLKKELESDGFSAGEYDEEAEEFSVNVKVGNNNFSDLLKITNEAIANEEHLLNLILLSKKLGDIRSCCIEISWLGAETSGEDNFAWFLEWLHTPGRALMMNIFKKIKDLTSKSIFRLEFALYTICDDDYDEDGYTNLKNDEYSYRDDEISLYYEGIEIPVNEGFLREFFLLKGFKFSIKRDVVEKNMHVALIDWS